MSPETGRKLDYSYIASTPNDGKRYELVQGDLFVSPSPSTVHQRVSRRLERQLEGYFHDRRLGEVFNAPTDVILTPHDVFVPDLLVVGSVEHISKRGIEKPPILVVEILSPSNRAIDLGVKFRRYAELGVRHYWIVDPDRRRLDCYRLVHDSFELAVGAEGDAALNHPDWRDLSINLAALWRDSPLSS